MNPSHRFTQFQRDFLRLTIEKSRQLFSPKTTGYSYALSYNHNKALDLLIEDLGLKEPLENPSQKWYKISDRLPPIGANVLVQFNLDKDVDFQHIFLRQLQVNDGSFVWAGGYSVTQLSDNQAWTFIPKFEI